MSFEKALEFTLAWEGGYVNDPKDPGGETKFGISKRAHPEIDIKNLDKIQAANIYKTKYWIPLNCQLASEPLDMVLFDTGVNCGVARTNTWSKLTNSWRTFIELRLNHYNKLRDYKDKKGNQPYLRFYKGWMNRLNALKKKAEENNNGVYRISQDSKIKS